MSPTHVEALNETGLLAVSGADAANAPHLSIQSRTVETIAALLADVAKYHREKQKQLEPLVEGRFAEALGVSAGSLSDYAARAAQLTERVGRAVEEAAAVATGTHDAMTRQNSTGDVDEMRRSLRTSGSAYADLADSLEVIEPFRGLRAPEPGSETDDSTVPFTDRGDRLGDRTGQRIPLPPQSTIDSDPAGAVTPGAPELQSSVNPQAGLAPSASTTPAPPPGSGWGIGPGGYYTPPSRTVVRPVIGSRTAAPFGSTRNGMAPRPHAEGLNRPVISASRSPQPTVPPTLGRRQAAAERPQAAARRVPDRNATPQLPGERRGVRARPTPVKTEAPVLGPRRGQAMPTVNGAPAKPNPPIDEGLRSWMPRQKYVVRPVITATAAETGAAPPQPSRAPSIPSRPPASAPAPPRTVADDLLQWVGDPVVVPPVIGRAPTARPRDGQEDTTVVPFGRRPVRGNGVIRFDDNPTEQH